MRRTKLALLLFAVLLIGTSWNLAAAIRSVPMQASITSIPHLLQKPQTTPAENLSEVEILKNGGFENGLEGWMAVNHFVGAGNGYPSVSSYFLHSGSGALALNFLPSNPAGGSGQPLESTGVYQVMDARELRGLRVEAWFMMLSTVSQLAARMRVEVGGLTVNYYVAYDSEQRLLKYDTAESKSVFAYQAGFGSSRWLHLNRDVQEDFHSLFGSQGLETFQQNQTTITLGLELMGFAYSPEYQVMLWDDVQTTTLVPVSSTTTGTTEVTTFTATTVSTSSLVTTATSSQAYQPRTSALETATEGTVGGLLSPFLFFLTIAVVLMLGTGFIIAALLRIRRRSNDGGIRCGLCGYGKDIRPIDNYCPRCGMRLSPVGAKTAVSA